MLWVIPLVVLWGIELVQSLLLETQGSERSVCEGFVSKRVPVNCIGMKDQDIILPCGDIQENNFTYFIIYFNSSIYTSVSSGFLKWKLKQTDNGAKVYCHFNDVLQAVYILNVTFAPHVIYITKEHVPNPKIGQPEHVTCPLYGNPPSIFHWQHYSDIDQTELLHMPPIHCEDPYCKTWSVKSWEKSMNGFYTCAGSNSLGTYNYVNREVFRLFDEECDTADGHAVAYKKPSSGLLMYPAFDNVVLHCMFGNTIWKQPPNWFFTPFFGNTTTAISFRNSCSYHLYYYFDNHKCVWNTSLYIFNFSSTLSGVYWCNYETQVISFSVDLENCYKLERTKTVLRVLPGKAIAAVEGSRLFLSCIAINASPFDMPVWCKEINDEDCHQMYTKTSYDRKNCSWVNTIELELTDQSTGKYHCYIYDHIESVEVAIKASYSGKKTIFVSLLLLTIFVTITLSSAAVIFYWYTLSRYSQTKEPLYNNFKWDAFISYHQEAEDFAFTHIKQLLESRGYLVCWHHDDFISGRTIMDNINNAVDKSRKVIFVFTEKFVCSKHCMAELHRTLDRLQLTQTRCMIPIVLHNSHIPQELKSKVTYWPVIVPDASYVEKLLNMLGSPISKCGKN